MFNKQRPGPDYTLRWPRPLFIREARTLLASAMGRQAQWPDRVELLLEEAFVSNEPVAEFRRADYVSGAEPTSITAELAKSPLVSPQVRLLEHFVKAAALFPEEAPPRPYYLGRQAASASVIARRDLQGAQHQWALATQELQSRGYLAAAAPTPCVDSPDAQGQDVALDAVIRRRLGIPQLWLSGPPWDEDVFLSMVEVVHDLVARPRERSYHYELHADIDCGWHYSSFAPEPAQILYRWTVNRLFSRHGIELQLAKSGEDVGRLVQTLLDGRDALVTAALSQTVAGEDKIKHAISLFRDRNATVETKRSACVALIGVLESRRDLVKTELLTKDEGALFQIANQFNIRHHKADQHGDYDEAYLDWIFWWYLATVELTNHLMGR